MTRRCRYCAKPIPKQTHTVHFAASEREVAAPTSKWRTFRAERPKSVKEAQGLLHDQIVSVRWFHHEEPSDGTPISPDYPGFDYVSQATTWDGESHVDKYFCKGACARDFGYAAVEKKNLATDAYNEAIERDNKRRMGRS